MTELPSVEAFAGNMPKSRAKVQKRASEIHIHQLFPKTFFYF